MMDKLNQKHHLPRARELLLFASTQLELAERVAKATGEHFNLFKILGIGHREVTTHSPVLGSLLDPRGSHGQGEIFLKLFVERLGIGPDKFAPAGSSLKLEKYIGPKTEETGGRIDISISDNQGRTITIENKIYAGLQENQLRRYHNANPDGELIYLTLDGLEPDEIIERDIPIRCISYQREILDWLEECRKEVATVAVIRESITQYIHLIRELTNQNTNRTMSQEIARKVLEDRDSYFAFAALCESRNEVRKEIILRANHDLAAVVVKQGLRLQQEAIGDGRANDGWRFSGDDLESRGLGLAILFDKTDFRHCYFGIYPLDAADPRWRDTAAESIRQRFQTEFRNLLPRTGFCAHWWWGDMNWDDDTFAGAGLERTFVDQVDDHVRRMLDVIEAAG